MQPRHASDTVLRQASATRLLFPDSHDSMHDMRVVVERVRVWETTRVDTQRERNAIEPAR